jgi:hypothetical protein
MSEPWIFTPETMETILKMKAEGRTSRQIAKVIGSTSDSVRVTLRHRGMVRPRTLRMDFQMGSEIKDIYAKEAERRHMQYRILIRRMLTTIAKDNLFSAILDDGE